MASDPKTACMFYKGTLRSGQVFESDGSVVVLGDVNPGGKVVAKGSVIVLGSLKGNIFAGVDGNENAFVVALEMSPMQIKIGEIIARSSDVGTKITKGRNKTKVIEPKIAYVYDQNIYIEDLEQNALDDICLD
jgi:septum site-determining protein MinC